MVDLFESSGFIGDLQRMDLMHGMELAKFCQIPVDISDNGGTEKLPQYKFYQNNCLWGPNSERQASPLRGH
jgi:hypothetical protein